MSSGSAAIALALTLTLHGLTPRPLPAQFTVEVAAGARYSTALVHDSIVAPFNVRPALAPTVAVTLTMPHQRRWAAQLTLDFSTSTVQRHEADGASVALGRVSTAAFVVGVERRFPASLSARVGIGGLKCIPGETTGMFRSGSGSIAGLGMVALSHALPVGSRFGFAVEARYDVHRFTTPALRQEGFASARPVHRVALFIRARRGRP
jgi:hypothetical protein